VRITQAGLTMLAELDEPVNELLVSLLGHVKKKKLQALTELLDATRR
jgi:hypothetical protein